jgi:hypothetical protein
MATSGRYTPVEILKKIARLAKEKKSQLEIARQCDVCRKTVGKYFPPGVARLRRGRPSTKAPQEPPEEQI